MALFHRSRIKLTDLTNDTNSGVLQIIAPSNRQMAYSIKIHERGVAPTDKHSMWEIRRGFTGETSNRTELTTGYKEPVDALDTATPGMTLYTWASGSRPTSISDGDVVNAGMYHPQGREIQLCAGNLNAGEKHSLFIESDTASVEKWLILECWEGG